MENEQIKSKFPIGMILILILIGIGVVSILFAIFKFPVYQLGPILISGTSAVIIELIIFGILGTIFYGIIKRIKWVRKLAIGWYTFGLILLVIDLISFLSNTTMYDSYYRKLLSPEMYALMTPDAITHSLISNTIWGVIIGIIIIIYMVKKKDFFDLNKIETNSAQPETPVKKPIFLTAGMWALILAVLGILTIIVFHLSIGSSLVVVILGIYGIIKGDKLGKLLSAIAIVVVIITYVLFNPFQQIPSQLSPQTANGSVYSNSEYHFKITPPVGWLINPNSKNGIVTFVGPNATLNDYHIISIQLESGSNLNLDDYVNSIITEGKSNPNFSLINMEKFGVGSSSYYMVEYKTSVNSTPTIHTLVLIKQTVNGSFFWVGGAIDDKNWNAYVTTIRSALLSFTD